MKSGIYESLITEAIRQKINVLDLSQTMVSEVEVEKDRITEVLVRHLQDSIQKAFLHIRGSKDITAKERWEICHRLLLWLQTEIQDYPFTEDLIEWPARVLRAVFHRMDAHYGPAELNLEKITPSTGLIRSTLFVGGGTYSLETELKKEIRSANKIDLLISFIKWKAVVILREAFKEFAERGGRLRLITTTYMGATDAKAIEALSQIPGAEIKVSYNTQNERLHAKAYLFHRDSGFTTAYIGSSNFSRSALTDGLEWNMKVTSKETPHIIDQFRMTFDRYWAQNEFEPCREPSDFDRLRRALGANRRGGQEAKSQLFFDLRPYHYQSEILEKLQVERKVHGRFRNLVVAATGTGKTIISAFDFKSYIQQNTDARFLFIAHRIEILKQAQGIFQHVLRDNNFGELLGDGNIPEQGKQVFATIQTLANLIEEGRFHPDDFDYLVIDEVHHAQASSYQTVIQFFKPKILLGLTATPERADGKSILPDFEDHIAAEIRLPDALNRKLLCPFQYFAVSDSVDLDQVRWVHGRYDAQELERLYVGNDRRVRDIIDNIGRYCRDLHEVMALGFCVNKAHARYMDQKFREAGLRSAYLTSDNSEERNAIRHRFRNREFQYLFVVDMFNEGIDIPEVDTLLFLRPTESLTIFLQQLGRGLRLHEGKEVLTVLDFVGNAHANYSFEPKLRALIGKTNTSVLAELENDFVHLPLGCSILLEKKAREVILHNIKKATQYGKRSLIKKIQEFRHQTNLPLDLPSFLHFYQIPYQQLYGPKQSWTTLMLETGKIPNYDSPHREKYLSLFHHKWRATNSLSYFKFILDLAHQSFQLKSPPKDETQRLFLTMLHYDFWGQPLQQGQTLEASIAEIGKDLPFLDEIKAYLHYRISLVDFEESPCQTLPYAQPLQIHARYTRSQILAAFGLSTLEKKSENREGIAENKEKNTELLFINLNKSEDEFSPTTMYEDYPINERLFHWQTQNKIAVDSPKGRGFINHQKLEKKILLFVRESKKDEYGQTAGYLFLGPADYVRSEGSKPISITWKLQNPLPEFLLASASGLSMG